MAHFQVKVCSEGFLIDSNDFLVNLAVDLNWVILVCVFLELLFVHVLVLQCAAVTLSSAKSEKEECSLPSSS